MKGKNASGFSEMTVPLDAAYKLMFTDYPDIVDVKQMRKMLGGIGKKEAYRLLHEGSIPYKKDGKGFKVLKIHILEYMLNLKEHSI